jgi:probable HAF family extracellular repeat protein
MSTNGFVVVGDSPATSYPVQAFRWTAATGMVSIGTLPGQSVTEALGVNADGSVVVGYDGFGGCGNNVAFRWTQATGQVSLGFPPGGNYSIAYATNADARSWPVMPPFAGVATKPSAGPPRLVGWRSPICREP